MRCTDDDVRVGVIGHGGLLTAFSSVVLMLAHGGMIQYIPCKH